MKINGWPNMFSRSIFLQLPNIAAFRNPTSQSPEINRMYGFDVLDEGVREGARDQGGVYRLGSGPPPEMGAPPRNQILATPLLVQLGRVHLESMSWC